MTRTAVTRTPITRAAFPDWLNKIYTDSLVLDPTFAANPEELYFHGYINGKLYFGQGHATTAGKEWYCDPDGSNLIEIYSHTGINMWASTYSAADKKIYLAGEAIESGSQWRMAVGVIDVDPLSATYNQVTLTLIVSDSAGKATGGCNRLFMIYDDAANNRLILGEWPADTGAPKNTTGSDYPHGTGLWTVPKTSLNDDATYVRGIEIYNIDPVDGRWRSIVKFGGLYYAFFSTSEWELRSSPDLITWTKVSLGGGYDNASPVVSTFHDAMFVIRWTPWDEPRADNKRLIIYKFDGTTWTEIAALDRPDWEHSSMIETPDHNLLVFVDSGKKHYTYLVDPTTGGYKRILDYIPDNMAHLYLTGNEGRWNGNTMYYGTQLTNAGTSANLRKLVIS
ncbi:MAG: hypothetical protein WC911_03495 [Thermoleophilia bacterium]